MPCGMLINRSEESNLDLAVLDTIIPSYRYVDGIQMNLFLNPGFPVFNPGFSYTSGLLPLFLASFDILAREQLYLSFFRNHATLISL